MDRPRRRLLVVSHTGLVAGAETVLFRLVSGAVDAGWSIEAACPTGPLTETLEASGVRCKTIPDLTLPPGPMVIALARLAWRTHLAARRLHALSKDRQLIVVNRFFALPALRLARPQCPVVLLAHDVMIRRSWSAVLRVGRKVVDLAIAVSDTVAGSLSSRGVPVTVVRNGTPWPVEPMPDAPPSDPVIGCVGLLTPLKGQDVLLDAVSMLPAEVKVELVGGRFPKDAPYVQRLNRRADEPDLRGRVTFVGNTDDVQARMRNWSVGVSASVLPEAGPLAPLEAMSIGLPMVGTNHGGTPEVLGDAGLLVPPGDARAMAEALSRLLSDRELWQRCHAAGPRLIADGLTLDRQVRELLEVLADLADLNP